MGKLPWYLRYKHLKRDYEEDPHIPHDVLESKQLQNLRSLGDSSLWGEETVNERTKTIRVSSLDKLDEALSKAMAEIEGEYVDLKLNTLGFNTIATIIFKPKGGET